MKGRKAFIVCVEVIEGQGSEGVEKDERLIGGGLRAGLSYEQGWDEESEGE